ncbi:Triggering receptor expressed on myeloid cells 1, partial [Sciurus carolinensis]|nr:Triggering receptor expressed on myeloid cells 1 [Sciurus carolinensis]
EKCVLAEGETLTVNCPVNQKYKYSKKAWQRLRDGEQPQTLVVTESSQGTLSQIQVGRYILRDDPQESMLQVRMINLQVEDSGLYRCVIYYPPPKEPILLFQPVRLVVTTDTSDKNPTTKLTQILTLPTTNIPSIPYTSSRTVTPFLPTPTAVISPNTTVNLTKVTDTFRVSQSKETAAPLGDNHKPTPHRAASSSNRRGYSRLRKEDGMQGAGQRGWPQLGQLLLLLCVSGLQAEGEREERKCLLEGGSLTVTCPYNINKYATSLKAWQRVRDQGRLENLVLTETRNGDLNRAQAGRFLLEDYPTEAVIRVTMTRLRREDVGLYQCVIHLSSQNPIVLHQRIRLVECDGPPVALGPDLTSLMDFHAVICSFLYGPFLLHMDDHLAPNKDRTPFFNLLVLAGHQDTSDFLFLDPVTVSPVHFLWSFGQSLGLKYQSN